MDRLTIPDEPIEGGMRRAVVDARAVKEQAMTLYWKLKKYEDTGLEPDEILTGVQLAEIACLQIRYKKRQELLKRAAECIRGCYGRESNQERDKLTFKGGKKGMGNAMECDNKECEYICDTPLGSYCTLTNEPVETTRCHYEEQKDLESDIFAEVSR